MNKVQKLYALAVEKIVLPTAEPLQQEYLIDNIINAITGLQNAVSKRAIVAQAPTGSGKSFTLTNYTLVEIAKKFPLMRNFLFVAPSVECIDEPYESMMKFNGATLGTKTIRVYDNKQLKNAIDDNQELAGDIKFFFMTTQFMYGLYKNFDPKKPNEFHLVIPDLIINDEAHRGLGVPDAATTKEDTGTTNNNWDPKWFQMQEDLLNAGSTIVHLTATPTESQKMLTSIGSSKYLALDVMPKFKESNAFTMFNYHGNRDDLYETLEAAYKTFAWQVEEVRTQQQMINEEVWASLADDMPRMMPGIIISLGRKNAVNGIPISEVIDSIADFAHKLNGVLFVSTSDAKHFDGKVIKRMSDGIKLANHPDYQNKPLIMVVVDSGKMGINIPRLLTAVVCKIPSQQKIHNSYTQFVARTCRLPFFRDHTLGIDYIRNLKVSDTDKSILCSYYSLMSTSFAILPKDTELMQLVEEFYTTDTFEMQEGIDYILDGVFGKKDPAKLLSGLKLAFDTGQLNQLFRKDYCEACKGACFEQAVTGYISQYGNDINEFGDFVTNWKSTLQVDHIDGNRYNNDPSNHATVCPNVHMLKTQRQKDFLNVYVYG